MCLVLDGQGQTGAWDAGRCGAPSGSLGSHLQLMDRSCFLDILVSVVAFRFGLLQGTCELWFADGFGNNSFNVA